jgi:hypothetical protein
MKDIKNRKNTSFHFELNINVNTCIHTYIPTHTHTFIIIISNDVSIDWTARHCAINR